MHSGQQRYLEKFSQACDAKEPQGASAILKEAFEDPKMTELELGLLCTAAFERRSEYRFIGALQEFSRRFPHSLYPVQAFTAVLLAMQGRPEDATEDARFYLRKVRDSGLLDKEDRNHLLEVGIASAFLTLTAAYTSIGALDYAKRILAMGVDYVRQPKQQQLLRLELVRLEQELDRRDLAETSQRWERFFAAGENADELIESVKMQKFELLAKRLEILAQAFREGEKRPFDDELFQIVFLGEKDGEQYAVLR